MRSAKSSDKEKEQLPCSMDTGYVIRCLFFLGFIGPGMFVYSYSADVLDYSF